MLQRRHPSKDTYPNKLDISCAGHLEAGESPTDGIREIREELGIEVEIEKLHKVGVFKYSDASDYVKDNEFCHVFVLVREDDETLTNYSPALGELSGLYLIRVEDMQNICYRNTETVSVRGFDMDEDGRHLEKTISIRLFDMIKYDISYYEMLFRNLELALHH